jgi:RHS repeat-associated protein
MAATSTYGAYGAHAATAGAARTAYVGEVSEADTGWYFLGKRAYSPTLRRFLAPDHASPFNHGGINRYAYCGGDPVNRIDPSGRSWLSWLGASVGLTGRSAGANGALSTGSRDMRDAVSTPVTAASMAAAVIDAVSITSAIDSMALATSSEPNSGGLFGWIGQLAKVALGGSNLPPTRNGSPTRFISLPDSVDTMKTGTGTRPQRNITLFENKDIPASRSTFNTGGQNDVTRNWIVGTHVNNPRSRIWAADTAINYADFPHLFPHMTGRGVTNATLYSGVDGYADQSNWGANWFHKQQNTLFIDQDVRHTKPAGRRVGIDIEIEDVGDFLISDFRKSLAGNGDHIIGSCYGIADEVVMDALNLSNVTLYCLRPPPAP